MSQTKTIKFFISSTFKDFLKERNALQNFVFPKLKTICQEKGFGFQPIDLRWGVTTEISEDNQTMQYCLNEVARCSSEPKPNLFILVGQRYGWGPIPTSIEQVLFENIRSTISTKTIDKCKEEWKKEWKKEIGSEDDVKEKKKLLKEYEEVNSYKFQVNNVQELLSEWYIQDKNDVEQKYYLKDKHTLPSAVWRFIEKILQKYMRELEITKTPENYNLFHTSATEQEVRYALESQYKANNDNTLIYMRKFSDDNNEELIEKGDAPEEKLAKFHNYLKESNASLLEVDSISTNTYEQLQNEYENEEELPPYLKEFCDKVYNEFKSKILHEIESFTQQKSTLDIELEEQKSFLDSKSKVVLGRDKEIKEIKNFIQKSNEQYYLLYGESGSGKSSVMAKTISELIDKDDNSLVSGHKFIFRFIGTTAHTSSPRDTYEYIYWQIKGTKEKPNDIEYEDYKFYTQFREALQEYTQNETLTIFIDAVDQFSVYDSLSIFLDELPKNVKVVFSTLYNDGRKDEEYTNYFERLSSIITNPKKLEIQSSKNEEILQNWLEERGRTLTEDQYQLILNSAKNKTPLYLRLTFIISLEWKSTDNITKEALGEAPQELIIKYFDNVVDKHYVKRELLELVLGLISASKDGLSESELIDLLSREKEILALYERENSSYPKLTRFPDFLFSKLYYHIQEVFTEKLIDGEMLINPFHRIVGETIKEEYYEKSAISLHEKLANYFLILQDDIKVWDKRYYNVHMLSETPYQLFSAKDSKRLKEILFDLEFAGSVYDNHKQESFREIMEKAIELDDITENEIYVWESFYREKEHLITKVDEEMWRPHQSLFQLAYEDGDNSHLSKKADYILEEEAIDFLWLKNKYRQDKFIRTGLLNVIEEELYIGDIKSIGNNKIIYTTDHQIKIWDFKKNISRLLDSKEIKKFIDDKIIKFDKIYNYYEIIKPEEMSKYTIKGTNYTIKDVYKNIAFVCNYKNSEIGIYNFQTRMYQCITKHDHVYGAKFLDEKQIVYYESFSGKMFFIHMDYPNSIKEMKGHTKDIVGIKKIEEGKFISFSMDNTIRLWNLNNDTSKRFIGHTNIIEDVEVINKYQIVSYAKDNTIRLWNLEANVPINNSTVIEKIKLLHNKKCIAYSINKIIVFDIDNINSRTEKDVPDDIKSIQILPTGNFLSNVWKGDKKLWKINNNILSFSIPTELKEIGFDGDFQYLSNGDAVFNFGNTICIWDYKTLKSIDFPIAGTLEKIRLLNDREILCFTNIGKYICDLYYEEFSLTDEYEEDVKNIRHFSEYSISEESGRITLYNTDARVQAVFYICEEMSNAIIHIGKLEDQVFTVKNSDISAYNFCFRHKVIALEILSMIL